MTAMRSLMMAGMLLLGTLTLGSCSTPGAGSGGTSRNIISGVELEEAGLSPYTAWEAVQLLRPNWLRSRTSTITRGPDVLRSLRVENIDEMRYLNAQDATTRYGTGYLGGVIEVVHKR